jgi:proliferating cell nuclear antigen
MFEARFASPTFLKRILESIKDLVTDANLLCTEDGMELQAMDAAHVCLISLTILADACTTYSCSQTLTLGLSITNFSKILKCVDADDSLILTVTDDGSTLDISAESSSGTQTSAFSMNLMNIDADHLSIPDTAYACSVKMSSADFTKRTRDLQMFGDTCSLAVTEEALTMAVRGDLGSATVVFKAAKDPSQSDPTAKDSTEVDCSEPTTLCVAIKYLVSIIKAQGLNEQVTLFLSAGTPIHIVYDMGDRGSLGFHLAPKMEEA